MLHMIICDDDKSITSHVKDLIERQYTKKIDTFCCYDETTLMEHIKCNATDMIILDIALGESDGIAIAKDIGVKYPNIKVILLSGFAQLASNVFDADPVYFLSKPIKDEKLYAAVDKAIEIIEEEHDVKFSRGDSQAMISITNLEDTRILNIQATSANAEYACWVANAMAEATAERMQEITKKDPPTTVEKAEVSTHASNAGTSKYGLIGFVGGAALVCGVLLVLYLLNDNIRTEEDVEKYLGEVALVSIPYVKGKNNKGDELLKQKGAKRGNKKQ